MVLLFYVLLPLVLWKFVWFCNISRPIWCQSIETLDRFYRNLINGICPFCQMLKIIFIFEEWEFQIHLLYVHFVCVCVCMPEFEHKKRNRRRAEQLHFDLESYFTWSTFFLRLCAFLALSAAFILSFCTDFWQRKTSFIKTNSKFMAAH